MASRTVTLMDDIISRNSSKNLNVLSLFSGCGGMDLGFEGNFTVFKPCINTIIHKDWIENQENDFFLLKKTNFNIVFANDINKRAKIAWCNYFSKFGYPESIYYNKSIVNLIKQIDENQFSFPKNISVLTGGFPCQDFSYAGKRLGFNSLKNHNGEYYDSIDITESRGSLYLWMKKTIEITKPKVFIAENVKGLCSLSDAYNVIVDDFSEINNNEYLIIKPRILLSSEYGVPQSRERIIFIGFHKPSLTNSAFNLLSSEQIPLEYDPYPIKTHYSKSNKSNNPNSLLSKMKKEIYSSKDKIKFLLEEINCGKVLYDLPEPEQSNDKSQQYYSKARFLNNSSQGQLEIKLDKIGPTIRSEHHGNIEFRRLSREHGGKIYEELDKNLKERRLTVRECARIQTFPDDYDFVFKNSFGSLSASESYKLIGNAVPPLLAYHIAKRLEKNWTFYFGDNK